MPARKPRRSYISVTGWHSSYKTGEGRWYESLLERDNMFLLDFDDAVETYEEQPVSLTYTGTDGRNHKYTPDVKEIYVGAKRKGAAKFALVEVKTTEDLKRKRKEYSRRFSVAREYAKTEGGIFRVRTELDIRGPRLCNLVFLRQLHTQSLQFII